MSRAHRRRIFERVREQISLREAIRAERQNEIDDLRDEFDDGDPIGHCQICDAELDACNFMQNCSVCGAEGCDECLDRGDDVFPFLCGSCG